METNEIEVELEPDAQPSIYISGELLAYLFGKDDE